MELKDVIKRIRYFRNEKKLSARELSLMIGKNVNYINRLECGGFNLPNEMVLKIIDALEISPSQFFAENYQNYDLDNDLYNLIRAMPITQKQSLLEFLKKI